MTQRPLNAAAFFPAGVPAHKGPLSDCPYDLRMKRKRAPLLPVAVFFALAFAFDYFSVAAVLEVGFEGIQRLLLTTMCIIVGTISAYLLTSTLIRACNRR
jgi:hypothetical protein